MATSPLHIALEVDGEGAHPAAWRRAAHAPADLLSAARWREVALAAENAGITLATVDDALTAVEADTDDSGVAGRLDAVVRTAFVAPITTRVGLAPTAQPRAVEPFHLAAQLASLDIASLGRGAWVVTDDDQPGLAEALDRAVPTDPAGRRAEVADVVRAVRALWDSWEDDAVVKDVATGRYIDRDRVHYVDVHAATFSVKGPLITPRPPQGQLVVLADPRLLPADEADVALVAAPTEADTVDAAAAARAAGAPLAFAELDVALDTPGSSAADRLAWLDARAARPASGRLGYVGDADGLVELLARLASHVDGVRLHPAVLDEDVPVLTGYVLPALNLRRVTRAPVPGETLRTTLGLPRPANRFRAATEEDAA